METLRYVVLVNALLAVVSFAFYALLRRETFFRTNRLVLWLGLGAALLLPLLELPDWRPQPVRTVMHRTAQVIVPRLLPKTDGARSPITITYPNQKTYPAFQRPPEGGGWSWPLVLLGIYASGVMLLLLRLGVQVVSLRKLIDQAPHELYTDFTLVRSETVVSPFSFFGWVVLNPDCHTPEELDQILRHERVHVRERHSLDMLGAELVCIAFWFNPAAYLFRHLLHQTLEFSADQAVLAEGIDARAYQYNLVKVSLSAGQSDLTNQFGTAQLKARIGMLNRSASSQTTWLKYPVFFIVALTVASAFARPQLRQLSHHLPKPLTDGIQSVLETPVVITQPIIKPTSSAPVRSDKSKKIETVAPKLLSVAPAELTADSLNQVQEERPTLVSPSRYIVYQGSRMWWIITPLFKFDDFVTVKNELARHGALLQLIDVRYNWAYTFIDHLDYKLVNATGGGSSGQKGNGKENTPIYASGGFLELSAEPDAKKYLSSTSYVKIPATARSIPEEVRRIIAEDDSIANRLAVSEKIAIDEQNKAAISSRVVNKVVVARLDKSQYMEDLIQEGQRRYGHLGIGFRQFDREEVKKQSTPASYLSVKENGFLSVDKAVGSVKFFINNEPTTPEAVSAYRINQLYTVAVILGYDETTQKRSGTEYVLFYIEKN